jgi:hypothetical protein
MTLLEYKNKHKFTYDDLAENLEVERLILYRICTNPAYCPKLNAAYKIVNKSQGQISIEDLLGGGC